MIRIVEFSSTLHFLFHFFRLNLFFFSHFVWLYYEFLAEYSTEFVDFTRSSIRLSLSLNWTNFSNDFTSNRTNSSYSLFDTLFEWSVWFSWVKSLDFCYTRNWFFFDESCSSCFWSRYNLSFRSRLINVSSNFLFFESISLCFSSIFKSTWLFAAIVNICRSSRLFSLQTESWRMLVVSLNHFLRSCLDRSINSRHFF
jgi:hypothetical protein